MHSIVYLNNVRASCIYSNTRVASTYSSCAAYCQTQSSYSVDPRTTSISCMGLVAPASSCCRQQRQTYIHLAHVQVKFSCIHGKTKAPTIRCLGPTPSLFMRWQQHLWAPCLEEFLTCRLSRHPCQALPLPHRLLAAAAAAQCSPPYPTTAPSCGYCI